jgi:hypothetical protein
MVYTIHKFEAGNARPLLAIAEEYAGNIRVVTADETDEAIIRGAHEHHISISTALVRATLRQCCRPRRNRIQMAKEPVEHKPVQTKQQCQVQYFGYPTLPVQVTMCNNDYHIVDG